MKVCATQKRGLRPWDLVLIGFPMTNKKVADQLLRKKKTSHKVATLKHATAIRVAAHRLGGVLTVQRVKKGFRLTESTAKVSHRRKAKKTAVRRRKR